MLMGFFFIVYVAASALVAYVARDTVIGFVGFLILSLIFTPFVMLLVFVLGIRRNNAS